MSEQDKQPDPKSLLLEERARRFNALVYGIGIGVGGNEEYDLRALGREIVGFHSTESEEEKDAIKEEISAMYDRLGESTNPKVGEAVVDIVMAEKGLF